MEQADRVALLSGCWSAWRPSPRIPCGSIDRRARRGRLPTLLRRTPSRADRFAHARTKPNINGLP